MKEKKRNEVGLRGKGAGAIRKIDNKQSTN